MTLYDRIARFYDPWSRSVTEDVGFYVEHALASGGPVVELAVGTGRIAVPIAEARVPVIGVDSSEEMLAVARAAAEAAGVGDLLDLRVGDLREPPVLERVPLAICPFRSLLHMETEEEKLRALLAARELLEPGGRFVFDVFAPSREDIDETHDRWLEREPGIFERAVWDEGSRTLSLSVRSGGDEATFGLHWLSAPEWLRLLDRAALEVEALYGWFDLRPHRDEEDMIFVCRKREPGSD
jgi:SAM-dependent methyltransferase